MKAPGKLRQAQMWPDSPSPEALQAQRRLHSPAPSPPVLVGCRPCHRRLGVLSCLPQLLGGAACGHGVSVPHLGLFPLSGEAGLLLVRKGLNLAPGRTLGVPAGLGMRGRDTELQAG